MGRSSTKRMLTPISQEQGQRQADQRRAARQVSLLRVRGKFREAIDEANKLCAFPNALDPLVERAKIYQGSAPSTKYDDATAGWGEIRRRLERQVPSGEPRGKSANEQQRSLEQSIQRRL